MSEIDRLDLDSEEFVLTDEALERLAAAASAGCILCQLVEFQQEESDDE